MLIEDYELQMQIEEMKSILSHIASQLGVSPVELLTNFDRTVLMEFVEKLQASSEVSQ